MESQKLYLISSHSGPRLRYVASQVFERWLGIQFIFASPQDSLPQNAIRLVYGREGGHLQIPDLGFLKQLDFKEIDFEFAQIRNVHGVLNGSGFQWNTDIFSLIFWSLSRFEEYAKPELKDSHSRFPETEMQSHLFNFKDYPFVDVWVSELGKQLQSLGLTVVLPEFEREATLDIDNPTAFKYKGLIRNGASIFSHFLKGNWAQAMNRLEVSFMGKEDPFFTFDRIEAVCESLNIRPIYFIWIGDYGPNDKGLHFRNPFFQKLIQRIAGRYPVGIHPSYHSFNRPEQIENEKKRLEQVTNQPVTKSRQHYLRFRLPETYRQLADSGITDEFSMGFSQSFGFRAGTSKSFLWYDLENELETKLMIHPFSIMDSTGLHQLKISPSEFIKQANDLEIKLKEIGGTLSILFHNENFGGKMEWTGWESVFETVMKGTD